jgi:hypothetical protein
MHLVLGSERVIAASATNPVDGTVRWSPIKSLWISGMTIGAMAVAETGMRRLI